MKRPPHDEPMASATNAPDAEGSGGYLLQEARGGAI
jgi:hypothetical protein